jgi:hypothetical protein
MPSGSTCGISASSWGGSWGPRHRHVSPATGELEMARLLRDPRTGPLAKYLYMTRDSATAPTHEAEQCVAFGAPSDYSRAHHFEELLRLHSEMDPMAATGAEVTSGEEQRIFEVMKKIFPAHGSSWRCRRSCAQRHRQDGGCGGEQGPVSFPGLQAGPRRETRRQAEEEKEGGGRVRREKLRPRVPRATHLRKSKKKNTRHFFTFFFFLCDRDFNNALPPQGLVASLIRPRGLPGVQRPLRPRSKGDRPDPQAPPRSFNLYGLDPPISHAHLCCEWPP